jgi:hypothetical protein
MYIFVDSASHFLKLLNNKLFKCFATLNKYYFLLIKLVTKSIQCIKFKSSLTFWTI